MSTKGYFIKGTDIYYPTIVQDIKKSTDQLQPIYEAFTNSMESILLLGNERTANNIITIRLYHRLDLQKKLFFENIIIEDDGVGFDDTNFDRLTRYKDTRKGFKNKGSGRIQLIHFFNEVEYFSTYKNEENTFSDRHFILSKTESYLDNNSILRIVDEEKHSKTSKRKTLLRLKTILEEQDCAFYDKINVDKLKEKLLNHYIASFCTLQDNLPLIKIEQYVNEVFERAVIIDSTDLPIIQKKDTFSVPYSKLVDGKIVETDRLEQFSIISFAIDKNNLDKNEVKLTVKDEIVENTKLKIQSLPPATVVDDKRLLFLISSEYLNEKDSDTRGNLNIPNKVDFVANAYFGQQEDIIFEDIENNASEKIISIYPVFKEEEEKKQARIDTLKSMFLLNDEILKKISISINDTEEKILEKFYTAESKILAKRDSRIKEQIEDLNKLDPSLPEYEEELKKQIDCLVKEIPLQNRVALTQYVARRKLVLELFEKIQKGELDRQNSGCRNNDESLIHNLIFKQHSNDTSSSDLWLINEDFILFEGTSESSLNNLEYKGEKLFIDDNELTSEQLEDKKLYNRNYGLNRTDVLLFPREEKCIIIEFKALDVPVADHLNQINTYASLILNYSKDKFPFTQFYGYLIGEDFSTREVTRADSDFIPAQHFDFLFRPFKTVLAEWKGRNNGALYTEVIKYSTLLERAKKRNEAFISKLLGDSDN